MKLFHLLLFQFVMAISLNAQSTNADSIYTDIDTTADFSGGIKGWLHYLTTNLTYPPKAMAAHITGYVIVQFMVDKNGRVGNIKASNGHEILQKEAIRLIKNSPPWIAAIKNGEKVASLREQRINFNMKGSPYNQ